MISRKKKNLITFVTAGDPDLRTTIRLVPALEKAGADLVELGVPFSDPMADGPVIQKSSERSLERGTTLRQVLGAVVEIRKKSAVPLLLMGYYNPILSYGTDTFARDAARAGVNAVIVVDLPPEESWELDGALQKEGIDFVYLLTPTSDRERIRKVAARARGFIYFVSITGVTGGALIGETEIRRKISEIRQETALPIVIGFGINTPDKAAQMAALADGVVVGSALVDLMQKSPRRALISRATRFVKSLRSRL